MTVGSIALTKKMTFASKIIFKFPSSAFHFSQPCANTSPLSTISSNSMVCYGHLAMFSPDSAADLTPQLININFPSIQNAKAIDPVNNQMFIYINYDRTFLT